MCYLTRRMKGRILAIGIFSVLLITSSFVTLNIPFAYGQVNQMNASKNNTKLLNIQNIPAKIVPVGDIDIAYKIFGKGEPFLLISGMGGTKDGWEPSTLRDLSSNHTVVT